MQIKLLVEGGAMQPGPALAQKIGPLGLNMGQVISKVNNATKDFNGLKVPVELEIDPSTKSVEVKVFSPPVAELLKKELGISKGSGFQKKTNVANASIEQIISVAKAKQQNLLCKDLKSAVKTIVGTCTSLGIFVENKTAPEIEKDIDKGVYDSEIKKEITKTPPEKKEKLDQFFKELQKKQELALKQEQAAAQAASEAQAQSKEGAALPAAGGAPTPAGSTTAPAIASATAPAVKSAVKSPAKPEAKKK